MAQVPLSVLPMSFNDIICPFKFNIYVNVDGILPTLNVSPPWVIVARQSRKV